ncbi:MAG: tRNA (guanosine(37)-N1)-methyltransferase TrmD [Acidobacteriota bacterium]
MSEPLRIDVLTLFPELVEPLLSHSIIGRARERGLVTIEVHDLRRHAVDKHGSVDDAPYGGGGGMLLRPEPLFAAVEELTGRPADERCDDERVVLLGPAGAVHDQDSARRLACLRRLILICGRYEGIDDRVRTHLADETLSIGDYVLSGGEPAANVVIDSVVRLLEGALGDSEAPEKDSFADGLLEAPHYTRPAEFRGLAVPAVLLSGHHAQVERHRRREALRLTGSVRPDLLERFEQDLNPDAEEHGLLRELREARELPRPEHC